MEEGGSSSLLYYSTGAVSTANSRLPAELSISAHEISSHGGDADVDEGGCGYGYEAYGDAAGGASFEMEAMRISQNLRAEIEETRTGGQYEEERQRRAERRHPSVLGRAAATARRRWDIVIG